MGNYQHVRNWKADQDTREWQQPRDKVRSVGHEWVDDLSQDEEHVEKLPGWLRLLIIVGGSLFLWAIIIGVVRLLWW